ncbi:hypothetical protein QOT17_008795 [Balamuthia mandrillaris]
MGRREEEQQGSNPWLYVYMVFMLASYLCHLGNFYPSADALARSDKQVPPQLAPLFPAEQQQLRAEEAFCQRKAEGETEQTLLHTLRRVQQQAAELEGKLQRLSVELDRKADLVRELSFRLATSTKLQHLEEEQVRLMEELVRNKTEVESDEATTKENTGGATRLSCL